jgi:hypothetical protein
MKIYIGFSEERTAPANQYGPSGAVGLCGRLVILFSVRVERWPDRAGPASSTTFAG